MSQFELQPWEIGPRCQEPTMGIARGTLQGNEWRPVEMLPKKFVIFLRDNPKNGNWVVREGNEERPRIWSPKPPALKMASPEVGRLFAWDGQMAFIAPNGDGSWLDAHLRVQTPFASAIPSDIIKRSSRETFKLLSQQLEEDSDFAFARKWNNNNANRWALLLGSEELYNTIIQVLRAIFWEFGDKVGWAESNWRITHLASSGAYTSSLFAPDGSYSNSLSGDMRHNERLAKLLLPWSRFFAFEFLPRYTQEARKRHRCLEMFYNSAGTCLDVGFDEPPTYHERLEARRHLREWLKLNAPDRVDLLPD